MFRLSLSTGQDLDSVSVSGSGSGSHRTRFSFRFRAEFNSGSDLVSDLVLGLGTDQAQIKDRVHNQV